MNARQFQQAVETLGVQLSDAQVDRFREFEDALYRANEVMNLTRVPQDDCWQRHFLDSLLIQDLIPPGSKVLDIGTGPGFPAWPLACARPDLQVTALDSNGKMLGFLESHKLENLRIVNGRAEEWDERERFDFVTGRAVAPLSAQLEISAPFCRIGGLVVPMRSLSDSDSVAKIDIHPLGLSAERCEERRLPETEIVRLFPIYKKVQKTQRGFPRRWAELKKNPL